MGVRETKPFGVRMPEEIKAELSRQAAINGRSLNQEIVARLKSSLGQVVAISPNGYTVQSPGAGAYGEIMTDADRQLLGIFRKLSPEKQLALLSLLR